MTDWPVRDHIDVIAELVPLDGRRVVDVGCGKGVVTRKLAGLGAHVTGVEVEEAKLVTARAAEPVAGERYVEGRGEALPFPDAAVDVVVYHFSLHHVPVDCHDGALAEAARVLVPGGILFVAEPLAEGSFFELMRLVDDETEVRAAAQRTLARAPAAGFEPVAHRLYLQRRRYPDFAAVRAHSIAIDPSRAAIFDRKAEELERTFLSSGRVEGGERVFDQPVRADVFRRR